MELKHLGRHVMRSCLVFLVLAALRTARADEEASNPDMQAQWIRWGNGLKTDALIFNALATNPAASYALTQNPLHTNSFSNIQALKEALHDPAARTFMKYLVSCALAPDQQVSWTPSYTQGPAQSWQGGGGLCPAWYGGLPGPECLERVSACILARNNPAGVRVRISLRGGGAGAPTSLAARDPASPDTFTPPAIVNSFPQMPQSIPSLTPCDASSGSDCGWLPLIVGGCMSGATVQVQAQQAGVCGSLRACQQSRGCSLGDANTLGENTATCTSSVLNFTCPSTGKFSVISRVTYPATGGSWSTVKVIGGSSQILGEAELFPVREGAFYGNLFGYEGILPGLSVRYDPPSGETRMRLPGIATEYVRQDEGWCQRAGNITTNPCLPASPVIGPGLSIYKRMYVCADPAWKGDPDNLPGRVCALPTSHANCASHFVGSCGAGRAGGAGNCGMNPDGTFKDCQGLDSLTWTRPITTFMSQSP